MKRLTLLVLVAIAVLIAVAFTAWHRYSLIPTGRPPEGHASELSVAISPYQDIAMLVNAEPLGLAKKHSLKLRLVSMAWEDILPAVGSAGKTVDVGFGSLIEYLTKYSALNIGTSDPVVFAQPLYVYKGGGFVSLDRRILPLDATSLGDPSQVKRFLSYRIGAQRQSVYEMMVHTLASRVGAPIAEVRLFDTPMNDSLLALEGRSLDVASAGLTQLNEATKRGGRMVLSMEDVGFADVTGFICRKSVLQRRRAEIESLVRTWFDCVDYVSQDLTKNSVTSLDYLRKNASTQYTIDEYRTALSQEFLPRSIDDLRDGILRDGAKYDFRRLVREITDYLVAAKKTAVPAPFPEPLLGTGGTEGGHAK